MTPEQLARLRTALTPKLNSWIPVKPTPRQTVFLVLDDILEVLFGGAAGGGKSEALLSAAAQYVDVPNYAAIIFRKTYRDLALPGALMDRSHKWWDNTKAKWNSENHNWTFPSGAVIQFGYLEHDGDETRYQSAEFQYIGFDELTQFSEQAYTYMFSRLRRVEGHDVPLRLRGATNPGGKGHEWVKKRFNLPSGQGTDGSRAFVRSRLEDNPHLDIEMYERSLENLSPLTRAQLREGDWDASNSGGKFHREWFTIIGRNDIPERQHWERVVRHWDLASQEKTEHVSDPDYTAGASVVRVRALPTSVRDWFYESGEPFPQPPYWIILHVARFRKNSGDVEEAVAALSAQDGHHRPVSIEQERGASGKGLIAAYKRHVLPHTRTVIPVWAKGTKEERAAFAAGRAREGRVFLVEGDWNDSFLDELSIFGIPDVHDDQVDAFSGALIALQKLDFIEDQGEAAQH